MVFEGLDSGPSHVTISISISIIKLLCTTFLSFSASTPAAPESGPVSKMCRNYLIVQNGRWLLHSNLTTNNVCGIMTIKITDLNVLCLPSGVTIMTIANTTMITMTMTRKVPCPTWKAASGFVKLTRPWLSWPSPTRPSPKQPSSPQSPVLGRRWPPAAASSWTRAPCSSPTKSSQARRQAGGLKRKYICSGIHFITICCIGIMYVQYYQE